MTWKLKPKALFKELRENHHEMYAYKVCVEESTTGVYQSAEMSANVRKVKKWANEFCGSSWAVSLHPEVIPEQEYKVFKSYVYLILTDPDDAVYWELKNQKRIVSLMLPLGMQFFYKIKS